MLSSWQNRAATNLNLACQIDNSELLYFTSARKFWNVLLNSQQVQKPCCSKCQYAFWLPPVGGGWGTCSLDPLCPINITPCSQKCLSLFPRFVCLFYLPIHSWKFGKLDKIYLKVVVWLRFYCSICRDEEVTSHLLAYCTLYILLVGFHSCIV